MKSGLFKGLRFFIEVQEEEDIYELIASKIVHLEGVVEDEILPEIDYVIFEKGN